MENNGEKIIHLTKRKLIILIIAIAAAAAVVLLAVFRPWEASDTALFGEAGPEYAGIFENAEANRDAEVSFACEAVTDSQNNGGIMSFTGIVDGIYFVYVTYLDDSGQMSFNTGDTVDVTGIITDETMIPGPDGAMVNGIIIPASSLSLKTNQDV